MTGSGVLMAVHARDGPGAGEPLSLGCIAFSAGARAHGCNPCLQSCDPVIPVVRATRGAIKTSLR